MKRLQYTYWQDGEYFLGFLNDFPDYETQAYSKDELIENLKDLLADLESNEVPFIKKVEELVIA
jgi:predicted RNase H-like HicB family nuclease